MKRKPFVNLFAVRTGLAILLAALLLSMAGDGAAAPGREGELVPFFSVSDMAGETFDLRSTARQNTVIVMFWDSYMAMAVRELNFLNKMYGYYQLYGLEIAAVEGKGKDVAGVKEEIEKLRVIGTEPDYSVIPDPGGKIKGLYRVEEIPETFILSRRGEILYHVRGFREGEGERLEMKIKEFLDLLPAPKSIPGRSAGPAASPAAGREKGRSSVTVDPELQIYEKHYYFGNYYYNRGEVERALEYYFRCLEVKPEATEIHLRVGQIHADMKRYEAAREAWEKVLTYDPDNDEANTMLRRLVRGEF